MAAQRSAADDAEAHGLAAAARFTCLASLSGQPAEGQPGDRRQQLARGCALGARSGAGWAPGAHAAVARPARARRAGRSR
jgi:hypothetical protein